MVGEVGIQEELDLKGINHIGGPADAGKVVDLSPGVYLEHDHDVRRCSAHAGLGWAGLAWPAGMQAVWSLGSLPKGVGTIV